MNDRMSVPAILASLIVAAGLQAAPLSDCQLFFDPAAQPSAI